MIQIEANRENLREKIQEKNQKLCWSYYEQLSPEEQFGNLDSIKQYGKGLICNFVFSAIILGVYYQGFVYEGLEPTLFALNFQWFVVAANFFTLIETGCAIGYHQAVIVKNDFNADSIYIGKIVYGVSMICLKVKFLVKEN